MGAENERVTRTDPIQIGGAGPAGLAAAITLAKAGRRVLVHEAQGGVGHRFDADFQGLENWSTQQDALDLLREIGITTEFNMLPCSHGYAFDAWGERERIRSLFSKAHSILFEASSEDTTINGDSAASVMEAALAYYAQVPDVNDTLRSLLENFSIKWLLCR
jgi:2-polyprenyl-6-methoxyphenol hydroxylase-like FAD-dependent oxidoreductase